MAAAVITNIALDTDQAKNVGLIVIAAIVVFGLVISVIISAIIGRIITIVVVIGLGLLVWTQRSDIESAAKKCDASFFGVHVTPSDAATKKRCQQIANR